MLAQGADRPGVSPGRAWSLTTYPSRADYPPAGGGAGADHTTGLGGLGDALALAGRILAGVAPGYRPAAVVALAGPARAGIPGRVLVLALVDTAP